MRFSPPEKGETNACLVNYERILGANDVSYLEVDGLSRSRRACQNDAGVGAQVPLAPQLVDQDQVDHLLVDFPLDLIMAIDVTEALVAGCNGE